MKIEFSSPKKKQEKYYSVRLPYEDATRVVKLAQKENTTIQNILQTLITAALTEVK